MRRGGGGAMRGDRSEEAFFDEFPTHDQFITTCLWYGSPPVSYFDSSLFLCRSVFERFRAVLHEGEIDKRVQFIIEGLFAIRKAGFEASGFVAIKPELDLVEAGQNNNALFKASIPRQGFPCQGFFLVVFYPNSLSLVSHQRTRSPMRSIWMLPRSL